MPNGIYVNYVMLIPNSYLVFFFFFLYYYNGFHIHFIVVCARAIDFLAHIISSRLVLRLFFAIFLLLPSVDSLLDIPTWLETLKRTFQSVNIWVWQISAGVKLIA